MKNFIEVTRHKNGTNTKFLININNISNVEKNQEHRCTIMFSGGVDDDYFINVLQSYEEVKQLIEEAI